ncbi:MAG: radical SAM protein [Thermodesulfobacteriota bacterium]
MCVRKGLSVPPLLLLINPCIYDFAAYDLWSRPLGLLFLAGSLRRAGFRVRLIDCLAGRPSGMKDRPTLSQPVRRMNGTGKFRRERASRPDSLKGIPRTYSRYGISRQLLRKELERAGRPCAVLVTSHMTYWYPGVLEAIRMVREAFPGTPVILGGIYARLCTEHALRYAGADYVVTGSGPEAVNAVRSILRSRGVEPGAGEGPPETHPYPAFDLLPALDAVALLTSWGCPHKCPYCASRFLSPRPGRRDPGDVLEEVLFWRHRYGVKDFAFYDDALLAEADSHVCILLERLVRENLGVSFHTPNALHVRGITPEIARLLFLAGFRTLRLGLETSDMELHRKMGGKVAEGEFEWAVGNLMRVGYTQREIGAYVLMGLPGHSPDSVRASVEFVGRTGATPYLAEYSPIPHTPLWEAAVARSGYDLVSEPLYHNNTLLPCWDQDERSRVPELKELARRFRQGRLQD